MGMTVVAVTEIREKESERKLTLLKSANDVRADLALPIAKGDESPIKNPVKQPVRVGIYKGSMGNMDEGWTRYVFDTFNVPYSSVRDADVRRGNLQAKFDVLLLPSQRSTEIVAGNPAGSFPAE
jgi:hypothetical protein